MRYYLFLETRRNITLRSIRVYFKNIYKNFRKNSIINSFFYLSTALVSRYNFSLPFLYTAKYNYKIINYNRNLLLNWQEMTTL